MDRYMRVAAVITSTDNVLYSDNWITVHSFFLSDAFCFNLSAKNIFMFSFPVCAFSEVLAEREEWRVVKDLLKWEITLAENAGKTVQYKNIKVLDAMTQDVSSCAIFHTCMLSVPYLMFWFGLFYPKLLEEPAMS